MQFLTASNGHRLAFHEVKGQGPTVIWCGGLKSDMEGGKATHLHIWAENAGQSYIRFDYFGHGKSDGEFIDGTISQWANDVSDIIKHAPHNDIILIGSSMGGWASLLAAIENPVRVKALVLIAPAPDFTEKLTYADFTEAQKAALDKDGVVYLPSNYGEPYAYSKDLIEDGRKRQILDNDIPINIPIQILQGREDAVVPWSYSLQIVEKVISTDVSYTLVKGGDHSLSRPEDLCRLERTVSEMIVNLTHLKTNTAPLK